MTEIRGEGSTQILQALAENIDQEILFQWEIKFIAMTYTVFL